MPHSMSALIIAGALRREKLAAFDLEAVLLQSRLHLVWIDIFWSEHWQSALGTSGELRLPDSISHTGLLPIERAILEVVRELSPDRPVRFAVVWTDYFGGVGEQLGVAFEEQTPFQTDGSINDALRQLGVRRSGANDEFDTVGLSGHRHIPDRLLERWREYEEG